jgi:hypothetical protein
VRQEMIIENYKRLQVLEENKKLAFLRWKIFYS